MVAPIGLTRRVQKLEDAKCFREEAELRKQFRTRLLQEQAIQRLSRATRLDDRELLLRLAAAGFDVENIAALNLLPLAFAAWASGSVTERENRAAIDSISHTELAGNEEAFLLFERWLRVRPAEESWQLWEDFTAAQLAGVPERIREQIGERLLRQATQIALASGGFLGFGQICAAEQRVLDEIRRAYRLEAASSV